MRHKLPMLAFIASLIVAMTLLAAGANPGQVEAQQVDPCLTPTASPTETATAIPVTPTATATETATAVPVTPTATATETATAIPSATATNTATAGPTVGAGGAGRTLEAQVILCPTPTVEGSTTTTVVDSTTTTVSGSTTTIAGSTTTTVSGSTTTTIDPNSGAGVPTTTTIALGGELPATGGSPSAITLIGVIALVLGLATLVVASTGRTRKLS